MSGVRGLLVKLSIAALVAYAAILLFVHFRQTALLYPGAIGGHALPGDWAEPVSIATPDGERLWAAHAQVQRGRPTLLFFHGNADRADRYAFLADALRRNGIDLLALSYRGYPGSTGSPSEAGLKTDGMAAYDWLAASGSGPIFLLGQSLGSGVAVHVAAERPSAGLILVSAYDSIAAVAARAFWYLPVRALIRDPWRSDAIIGRVAQPKLFIHGRRDTIIPLMHGEALFAMASEPKRMAVADAGHNDLWSRELVAAIARFVVEVSPPGPAS